MLETECEAQCERCVQYTSPTGEIRYKCNDDLSKSKVIIIVSSVLGGIAFIVAVYLSIFFILKYKKKKKEQEIKGNQMSPKFETYFNLQDKANKMEHKKEKEKSISIESCKEDIDATPVQQRNENVANEHMNKIIIYSLNDSNMKLKTKSKILLNTMIPQPKKWNFQVNSPSPRNKKRGSISPVKKVNPRDRRKSHFFENNKIGRMVDTIMQNPKR